MCLVFLSNSSFWRALHCSAPARVFGLSPRHVFCNIPCLVFMRFLFRRDAVYFQSRDFTPGIQLIFIFCFSSFLKRRIENSWTFYSGFSVKCLRDSLSGGPIVASWLRRRREGGGRRSSVAAPGVTQPRSSAGLATRPARDAEITTSARLRDVKGDG